MQQLTNGKLLQGGKYKIERVLGQGGFGITYLAEQVMLGRKVAVKEFFMKELCERDDVTSFVTLGTESGRDTVNRFRDKFLKEARNIAKQNHPHIVRIIDVFEENGTAYYVMEYAENGSLADKVKREGYLAEPVATRYILQVADALDYIHQQKMNHLDVKPANIMLNEKDEAVLIDFGLSKQYDATTGNQTSTTPVGISEGYAPMEQYMQGGVGAFSPETDIYSLGATFYKLLTGVTPPNASLVNNEGLPIEDLKAKGISDNVISVVSHTMEGRKKDRAKSVREFIDALNVVCVPFTNNYTLEEDDATILNSDAQYTEEKKTGRTEKGEVGRETRNIPINTHGSKLMVLILIATVLIIGMFLAKQNIVNEVDPHSENITNEECTNDAQEINQEDNSQFLNELVDLGLSIKWAKCNIGATKPSDFGQYFGWGSTENMTYTYVNVPVGGPEHLPLKEDAANKILGRKYCIPTKKQCQELIDKCSWKEAIVDGVKGYSIVGSNGNSIFLPCAGMYYFDTFYNNKMGYWTSNLLKDGEREQMGYFLGRMKVSVMQPQIMYPIRPVEYIQ